MCDHGLSHDVHRGRTRRADDGFTRRAVLGAGAASVATLAGCLGDDGDGSPAEAPDPISLDDSQACDVCGMIIAEGYGPNGQVAYDGDHPPDRDGPAWYDSVRELYVDRFDRADRGTDPIVTYVTDYSTFDYEIETRNDDRYVTGSVAAETFVRAEDAVFVVDSGLQGSMGAELLPFGDPDDAASFVEDEGGEVVDAADVTPELVASV